MIRLYGTLVTTMYIDTSKTQTKSGKIHIRHLLRSCYRENGKIKHKTISNLSSCSDAEIQAMKLALKHKDNLTEVGTTAVVLKQGKAIGATWLLFEVAKRLGINAALGDDKQGRLALWQIFSRIIEQGSRLSSVRLAARHTHEMLKLGAFNEDDLYANLDWLNNHQAGIEDALFKQLKGSTTLFLYDVTSSYLEGEHNELATFGYNRDGKKGKLQIVIGLLCNDDGIPVAVEVFEGNTKDNNTLPAQVKKAADRFGVEKVTFVGDRGMIKSAQIQDCLDYGFHYITAITGPQVKALINKDTIQLGLFDSHLAEVTCEDVRYVLRRNPVRKEEIQKTRNSKLKSLQRAIDTKNEYLGAHKKAKAKSALAIAQKQAIKLKISKWAEVSINKTDRLEIVINDEALAEESLLDGCYVLKTDLHSDVISKEAVHTRYKDLAMVEQAFRTSKTMQLELRPINVRLATRTKGHVFVVMLAYRIIMELKKYWQSLDLTIAEGINALSTLCQTEVQINGQECYTQIPQPDDLIKNLLKLADVNLPTILPKVATNVTTRVKLQTKRKKL